MIIRINIIHYLKIMLMNELLAIQKIIPISFGC